MTREIFDKSSTFSLREIFDKSSTFSLREKSYFPTGSNTGKFPDGHGGKEGGR
nr:MAG TPA: hypothetical protein [Caudoviricetes sp.]